MDTRWRLVPRQYGTYAGEKTFDLEEVCIATNTMSFEDYLECRGIGGVAIVFSDRQFDVIHRHIDELGMSKFDLMLKIWEKELRKRFSSIIGINEVLSLTVSRIL